MSITPPPFLYLDGLSLAIADVERVARERHVVFIADDAWKRIRDAREIVEEAIATGKPLYGVTTGVGSQKDYHYATDAAIAFNTRLIRAHATLVPGDVLPPEEVRAALLILINSFTEGTSGITAGTVRELLDMLNGAHIPEARDGCSVGAGDLVPLAQIVEELLGGHVFAAKEALSLMCSNAVALAKASLAVAESRRFLAALDLTAAVALEGFRGNPSSLLAAKAHRERTGQTGTSANRILYWLKDSALWDAKEPRFLQDPLSYRCIAHIHGTAWQALDWASQQVVAEINACVDNPQVDLQARQLLSHGNMDTSMLTLTLDTLRQALGKAARVSGERLHKQHWSFFSGMPVGLALESGAQGGVQFLNFSHIAEAQLAQMHYLAAPVLLTYGGQLADGVEDTAGLAPIAARHLCQMLPYCWNVAALELVTSVWAVQRRGIPLEALGSGVRPVVEAVLPALPIGIEGEAVFDLEPIVEWLKNYVATQDL